MAPALALFLLAPLIGEFLLGNMSIDMLWLLAILAPLYGGGALLAREIAVRLQAGWPGIFALAIAYALIEEGLVTQSLFDPDYLGLRLLDYGHVPALGIGAWWTVFVLTLHVVWSMAVSICLAQALWPGKARQAWLSNGMLLAVAALFVGGCVATMMVDGYPQSAASPAQLAAAAGLALALGFAAVLHSRAEDRGTASGPVPGPALTASVAFLLLTAFMISTWFMASMGAAWNVAWMLCALGMLGLLVWRWSARPEWGLRQELGLATGALATYGWWSLMIPATVTQSSQMVDTAGNLILLLLAMALAALAFRAIQRAAEPV